MLSTRNWSITIRGKYGTPVGCLASAYGKETIVISAENEHLTEKIVLRSVERHWLDYSWSVATEYDYIIATGKLK